MALDRVFWCFSRGQYRGGLFWFSICAHETVVWRFPILIETRVFCAVIGVLWAS